jgi:(p)ppGpp synthase/HD superfamily hydrolase
MDQEGTAGRATPKGWRRLLLRTPLLVYRLHLGGLLGRRFPLLTHTGRRSGLRRQTDLQQFLRAAAFAARKHRHQRRKDAEASPYINHALEVASILAGEGGVTDPLTLVAAVLHDTLEDTETTPEELAAAFDPAIRDLVQELTDDKRLPKAERKARQAAVAPQLSGRAKLIRIADKIANVRDVTHHPPAHWDLGRRRDYLAWSEAVLAGCRGLSPALEACFEETVREGRRILGA